MTPPITVASIGLDGSPLASYAYTRVSRLASKSLEHGIATTYSYDAARRLVGLSHQRGSTLLAGFTYTLDSVGNRLSKIQSGTLHRTENYAYDAVDQLISAQYAGVGTPRSVAYLHDRDGIRGQKLRYKAHADNYSIFRLQTRMAGFASITYQGGKVVAAKLHSLARGNRPNGLVGSRGCI